MLDLKSLLGEDFEALPADFDFDQLSETEIDWALRTIVEHMSAGHILSYGDVYAFFREELNNEILELAAQNHLENR